MKDAEALEMIRARLDGKQWSGDTIDEIARLVRGSGRVVREVVEEKQEPIVQTAGEPYRCPSCGESDWRADYYNAVHQGVELIADTSGAVSIPVLADWRGDEETYDDACTEEDRYVCQNCRYTMGVFAFIPKAEKA